MPKTIRNEWNKNLTYEKLMKAHIDSRKGKGYNNYDKMWGIIKICITSAEIISNWKQNLAMNITKKYEKTLKKCSYMV